MPFALFHFHRAGLYGVAANIVAIPLTTFVIMPLEAGALLLDAVGWGKPLVVAVRRGDRRPARARACGRRGEGAVALCRRCRLGLRPDGGRRPVALPVDHAAARCSGLVPVAVGALRRAAGAGARPAGHRRRPASRGRRRDGTPLLLRDRAGDFVRELLAEASGFDGDPRRSGCAPFSACSRDACVAAIRNGRGEWRLLATRSATRIDWAGDRACLRRRRHRRLRPPAAARLHAALAQARPRGAGAHRRVAIYLGGKPRSTRVADASAGHPWAQTRRAQARAPHGELASRRIDEVEAAAAREGERSAWRSTPPALVTASKRASRSSTRTTGSGADRALGRMP